MALGSISAGRNVGQAISYGSINATVIADGTHADLDDGRIASIVSHGDISGTVTAATSIDAVHSGADVTATLIAPSVSTPVENDPDIALNYPIPEIPDSVLASVLTDLDNEYTALTDARAEIFDNISETLAEFADAKTLEADAIADALAEATDAAAEERQDAADAVTEDVLELQESLDDSVNELNDTIASIAAMVAAEAAKIQGMVNDVNTSAANAWADLLGPAQVVTAITYTTTTTGGTTTTTVTPVVAPLTKLDQIAIDRLRANSPTLVSPFNGIIAMNAYDLFTRMDATGEMPEGWYAPPPPSPAEYSDGFWESAAWGFTRTVLIGEAFIGGAAVVCVFFPVAGPIIVGVGGVTLLSGAWLWSASERYDQQNPDERNVFSATAGGALDVCGLSSLYGGWYNEDIITGDDLNLTMAQRGDYFGSGAGQVFLTATGSRIFKGTSRVTSYVKGRLVQNSRIRQSLLQM